MPPVAPPLFSVIVPAYNAAAALHATIDSALGQAPGLAELIVIDGASTDGTAAVLESYAGRIRSVSQPDTGVYDAMNRGMDLARGRWFYFLGAGDRLRPGALAQIAARLPEGDAAALVYGDVFLEAEGRVSGRAFTVSDFRRLRNVYHQAIFYSRAVFDLLGPYDLRYPIRADNAINLRAWASPLIVKSYVPIVVADYQGGGMSERREDSAFLADFPRLVRTYLGPVHYALYLAACVKYRFVPHAVTGVRRPDSV